MPLADNGGFDTTIEVAVNALGAAVRSSLPLGALPPTPVAGPGFNGQARPAMSITGVALAGTGDLTLSASLAGTVIHVTNLAFAPPGVGNPPPLWLADVPLGGSAEITDRLEMRGTTLVIDYSPTPVLNQPRIVTVVDSTVFGAPLIQFALAWAFLSGGQAGYQQARDQLLQVLQDSITNAVQAAVTSLGTITLVPPPTGLAVVSATFTASTTSLHVLYTISGGSPGNTALMTRSMLLSSSLTGQPVDAAALDVSNTALLRSFVRPAIAAALGLPPAAFFAGHPCMVVTPTPVTIPGGLPTGITGVTLNSLIAGIDDAGLLRVLMSTTAAGSAGAFSVTSSIDNSMTLTVTLSGGVLTFAVTPTGPPVVSSDVSIAWWMYLLGAVAGGLTLVGIIGVIDAFGGQLLNGPIASAIAAALPAVTFPVALPARIPPLAIRTVRTAQPDSTVRTLTVGPVTLSDPFRSHDLMVNFV